MNAVRPDLFISCAPEDSIWVQQTLIPRLVKAGLRIQTEHNFSVGGNFILQANQAIETARQTLIVLSPDWVNRRLSSYQGALATYASLDGDSRLIPLLLRPCELPIIYRALKSLDFTDAQKTEENFLRLLRSTPHVFIAHATEDSEIIQRLEQELEGRGIRAWVSRTDLPVGSTDWQRAIRQSISAARGMIYCASPNALNSPFVQGELEIARDFGVPIYPAWVSGERWSESAPMEMLRTQRADLRANRFATGLEDLIFALAGGELKPNITPNSIAVLQPSLVPVEDLPAPMAAADPAEEATEQHAVLTLPGGAPLSDRDMLVQAMEAYERGEYGDALKQFKALKANGYVSEFTDLDTLIADTQRRFEDTRVLSPIRAAVQRGYDEIAAIARPVTLYRARAVWERFLLRYPDWRTILGGDPELLASRLSIRIMLRAAPPNYTPILGDVAVDEHSGATMVYVPSGSFRMGSIDDPDEQPIHEVKIVRGFWIDMFPVTNQMYQRFIDAGGYQNEQWWMPISRAWLRANREKIPNNYEGFTADSLPRVGITWHEASAYAAWRGCRLPTEAEWEYAARGPRSLIYPWGQAFVNDPAYVIYGANSGSRTHPVGESIRLKGASWCGALDMSGNVWEWTSSLHKSYPYDPEDGRESSNVVGRRVVRGGSWGYNKFGMRASSRVKNNPEASGSFQGLRLVVSLPYIT
ncbi:MAG: hypothetical protein OHK0023_20420 [Anaerolineae bacterium]